VQHCLFPSQLLHLRHCCCWVPSLLHTPTAHCTTPTNSSAWFNTHYKATIGPLLTGAHHELSSDVVQWWLISELFNVFWALTVDAWDPSHFSTCAVVGNSGQLKESSHGMLIDAHDWVLRNKVIAPCTPAPPGQAELCWAVTHWLHCVGLTVLFQHGEHHITPLLTQVLILSPDAPVSIQHWLRLACPWVSMFGFRADTEGNWQLYWEKTHWSGALRRTRAHATDVEFSLIERRVYEGRLVF
uniref:Uncharacterized protein n=1 Tax=Junco hyemalis TaxID=40217 RepID=A0A8C5IPU7_JUNHY